MTTPAKKPRLFYFEEAEDCWVPINEVDAPYVCLDAMDDGEVLSIQFKRQDMTDAEYDAIPEG